MNRQTILAGFLLSLFLFTATTFAIPWKNRIGVGFSPAIYKMWGGERDRSSLSYHFSIDGRYGISPYIQLGADIGYGTFKPSTTGTSTIQDEASPYQTTVIPFNVSAKFSHLVRNEVKPYVLVGGGFLLWNLTRDGDNVYSGLQFNPGLSYAVGFEWFINKESIAIDLQGRNTHYFGMDKDNVGLNDNNDKLAELKLSLLYYWGGNFDQDGDGIVDKLDQAPQDPEDHDGFQDADGIPDFDNDNDLIPDAQDGAPLEPEDRDGFQDEDGIPDPDNDGDGILDANDIAPNAPEDMDGWLDDDGSPDIDNDGDGFKDDADKCPNEAEVRNGFEDDDGCPDELPLPPIFNRDVFKLEEVNFETGKADLTPSSFAALDKIVQGMQDFPEVEIEIRGYTDDRGDDATNQRLSEKRANSVRQYLVDKGIDSSRVVAIGFGERYPIADNSTEEGRAKNRRIEMQRVK